MPIKKLNVLSLGYTKELFNPSSVEKGDTSERMKFYAKYLNKYYVLVFSRNKHGFKQKRIENMNVIPTNGGSWVQSFFRMYRLGKEICENNKIDIIQAQDPVFTAFIGYLLKIKYKIPLNLCVYGFNPYNKYWIKEAKINLILAPIGRYIVNKADGVQTDGSGDKQILIRNGLPSSKIFCKPMIPLNIEEFKNADGREIRKKLLRDKEERIILFVGRLTKQKNIPFLLKCYKDVIQKFPKARLVIVGKGKEGAKLKKFSKRLKIQHKISWVEGIPHLRIPEYFKAADIFALPSLYEGFARVLMEATAAGKPIVSTRVSGVVDAIIDKENGFIIPQGNEKEFVKKILFLLKNPETAKKMGERGQKIIDTEERFNPRRLLFKQILIWNKLAK